MTDPVDILLSRLDKVQQIKPNDWKARCPAHEDRNPSLSIARGDDGRVLLRCWSGCGAAEIVQAVGLTLADLFVRDERAHMTRTRRRQYPNYRKVLQLLRHELEVIHVASQDLAEGKPLNDDDMRTLWRARANVEKAMRAANV